MIRLSHLVSAAALVSGLAAGPAICAPMASHAAMRVVDGQAYWTGDPGPVDGGAFYDSGQAAADPHHYLSWYGEDPQDYRMTIRASHAGPAGCVLRQRVMITDWDFRHPYLRVCD